MFYGTSFAGQYDDCTLTVAPGKPPVEPEIASINEDVEFNFVLEVIDKNGKKIEVKPSDVKSVSYTLTSDAEKIKSCTPKMKISANKMSASATKDKLLDVAATVNYPVEGDHTLTLDVTVTFKDDSTLSGSCTLTVKVYKAMVTIYAKSPQNPLEDPAFALPGREGTVGLTGGDMGHSFWKVEVTPALPGITDKTIWLTLFHWQQVAGCPYGFYPNGGKKGWKWLAFLGTGAPGIIKDDSQTAAVISISYPVKIDKAEAVIDATRGLVSGQYYHWGERNGYKNCTGQAVHIVKDIAGCNTPEGKGWVLWRSSENTEYRIISGESDEPFPNPYHHAQQLSEQ